VCSKVTEVGEKIERLPILLGASCRLNIPVHCVRDTAPNAQGHMKKTRMHAETRNSFYLLVKGCAWLAHGSVQTTAITVDVYGGVRMFEGTNEHHRKEYSGSREMVGSNLP
jgi:hypothetical protein